ncbi:MAG: hypothetical protein AAFZ15_32595 [Bacteroidota bacterium]
MDKIKTIREFISNGELDKALETSLEIFEGNPIHDNFVLLNGQYQDLKRRNNVNVISNELYTKEVARINFGLINLLANIESNEVSKYQNEIDGQDFGNIVRLFKESSSNAVAKSSEEIRKQYTYKLKIYNEMFASFENNIKTEYPNILFERIIYANELEEIEYNSIASFSIDNKFEWYDKCLVVSALTIRLINRFDISRFELLVNFLSSFEHKVWQRALVGVLLSANNKSEKIKGYPHALNKLIKLRQVQIIREGVTYVEEIFRNKKFQYDEDKLEMYVLKNNSEVHKIMEREEVSWEEAMKIKLQSQLSQNYEDLQVSGFQHSMLLGLFKKHKNYPFFEKPQHWFLPFYANNPFVNKAMEDCQKNINTEKFINLLASSLSVCNSDKYSLCFALDEYSDMQVKMCLEIFAREQKGLTELFKEDPKELESSKLSVFDHYIQDLYTFYLNYPKNEFKNFFSSLSNIYESDILEIILEKVNVLYVKGNSEYLSGDYTKALATYLELEKLQSDDAAIKRRIAHCYRMAEKDYSKAIYYHEMAYKLEPNNVWNLQNTARCHTSIESYKKAKEYLQKAIDIEPDNLETMWFFSFFYASQKKYADALKFDIQAYQKKPTLEKLHSVGFRFFQMGDLAKAFKIFKDCLQDKKTGHYAKMNLGHVLLCDKQEEAALKLYVESSTHWNYLNDFLAGMDEDWEYLEPHGISKDYYEKIKRRIIETRKESTTSNNM